MPITLHSPPLGIASPTTPITSSAPSRTHDDRSPAFSASRHHRLYSLTKSEMDVEKLPLPSATPSPSGSAVSVGPDQGRRWFNGALGGISSLTSIVPIPALAPLAAGGLRGSRRRYGSLLAVLGLVCTGIIWINGVPAEWGDWKLSKAVGLAADDSSIAIDSSISPVPTSTAQNHPNRPATATAPIQTWGLDLSSQRLLAGLTPWPDNPPQPEDVPPLSSLGHFADSRYLVGPLTLPEYYAQLEEFIQVAFPKSQRKALQERLDTYLRDGAEGQAGNGGGGDREPWNVQKLIWQTDKNENRVNDRSVKTWKEGLAQNEGWKWDLVTDKAANRYVSKQLKGSQVEMLWNVLPIGILKADMLRYLLLYMQGGIYSDTDTVLLKEPSRWGHGARLWRDGMGWLEKEKLDRLGAGEEVRKVLEPPSVVVGVEADVGDREDWYDWWPRPMQIVQWTMAAAPNHPITLSALLRIMHATGKAIDWSQEHAKTVKILNDMGEYDQARSLLDTDVMSDTKQGGPVGIMDWTGPGVWTDAVASYLRVKYGMMWTDLREIREPLRVGDVVILPVTGFSPGVGNFGSQPMWDGQAMVEHGFRGSWKHGG